MIMRVNIIFRQGLIGDTIVAIPALHYLRGKFPHSKNIYISMVRSKKHCKPSQILDGSGLIDKFILVRKYSHYLYIKDLLSLYVLILKNQRHDSHVYFLESGNYNLKNKKKLLQLLGIVRVKFIDKFIGQNIVSHLLEIVGGSSIIKDNSHYPQFIYNDNAEGDFARSWLKQLRYKKVYVLAINANFQSRIWKVENFLYVAKEIYRKTGAKPILMGGGDDIQKNQSFVSELGFGYNAAGIFTLKHSIEIMKYMGFYLGNDTGVMHMAALSNIKCFSVISGINDTEKWLPYGNQHNVYSFETLCGKCMLRECNQDSHLCMDGINADDIIKDVEIYVKNKPEYT
jgi:heptosyltransferase III